jgi:membrane protein implicated in regulation of membrane protease activity
MGVWLVWLVLEVVLGHAEIFTLNAVLGSLSAAALITSIAAAVGIPVPIQLGVFAVASVVGVVLIRPVVRRHLERPSIHVFGPAAHVGKTARVVHEIHGESGRVRIDGEDWTARTYDEALVILVGTVVDVLEINGVIALVYPKE